MKVRHIYTLIVVCCLAGIAFAPAKKKWERLGTRTVNHALDRDEIQVNKAGFTAVKLKVKRRKVNFRDMKIHYGNGNVQDVTLRAQIPAGGETRKIQLDGSGRRVIRTVVFWYRTTKVQGRRANVELWGER